MARKKRHQLIFKLPEDSKYQLSPLSIVADGAIATGATALGKLIPVLVIDTTIRADINDIIEAHTVLSSGDVAVQWGRLRGRGIPDWSEVTLILHFIRPVETYIVLSFALPKQITIVDQIIRVKSLYIQVGAPGDRVSDGSDDSRVLVEVPDTGFETAWQKILLDHVVAEVRARGHNRRASLEAARRMIDELNRFGDFRLKYYP